LREALGNRYITTLMRRYIVKYHFVTGIFLVSFILVLAACGSNTAPSGSQQGQTTPSGTQTVQVTLSDNKVDSSLTTFTAGMPYHFVITNTGQVAHQFVMIPMGMGMEHMSVDEMHHAALYMYDSVAPGESRMFDYTFAASTAGQSLQFACGNKGHYAAGMQLPFMVNPHE
jgi:uncharacterized cupredoxin-like copper-binding protein